MFEIREVKNKSEYIPLLINKNAPFTQAWFYGEWQEAMGRKVWRFGIYDNSEIFGFFQVIKYPLPFGQSLIYIAHGPLLRQPFAEGYGTARQDYKGQVIFLKEFRDKLLNIAKEESAIFVRFDSYFCDCKDFNPSTLLRIKKVPSYTRHSVYFQPKYEWILALDKPENELLGGMPKDSRYDIRYAENKGVITEIFDNNLASYLEIFYGLMEKTARRGNFNLHPKEYYKNILLNCEKNNNAFFVVAKYNNTLVAMNFVLIFGETAYVVFGGSDDNFKHLRAPRLAYWKGIIAAKNKGCKFYNFGGVSSGNDYASYGGISEFKKGFGGKMLEYPDSCDLIIKPFWRWLYHLRKFIQEKLYNL